MNWKELYAFVNENIKNAVSGLYKPAGDVTFAELPELSQRVLGYTYTVTDAFTTDSRFTDYDTETQTGHSFPADTEVAVIVTGTTENPVYMFNVMGGIMDGYATKSDLNNYVEKEAGKSLSTNDYTDADKALVQDSPITTTATGSDLALSTSFGNLNALTVYGKSEVVDGAITSAGEGWNVVDLGTLTWTYIEVSGLTPRFRTYALSSLIKAPINNDRVVNAICSKYQAYSGTNLKPAQSSITQGFAVESDGALYIKDTDYTDATAFKNSLSGVILAYALADPTQGNAIAIKADNGTGINGTMAVFSTGTPLRGIPDSEVRDVMVWDGSAGTVTKKCGEVDLGTLTWTSSSSPERHIFRASLVYLSPAIKPTPASGTGLGNYLIKGYFQKTWASLSENDDGCYAISPTGSISLIDHNYDNTTDFVAYISGEKLVYEVEAPTTEQLTTTENTSIAGLRTFEPQTHAQNNAGATMTVDAYAGTENGRAVNELKQNVQSEISALKITQSGNLTLTTAGWTNNAQTVTYAHDTTKRNVIDVDPSSIEEWANCGVLATAETASGIMFSCKTVPENALTFRVTSMGVN